MIAQRVGGMRMSEDEWKVAVVMAGICGALLGGIICVVGGF